MKKTGARLIKEAEKILKIHEVNTFKEFLELRSSWNEILKKSVDNSATLTWEHVSVSVKNLEKNQRLRILYITSDDKIIAIAPLRTSHYKLSFIGYNVIEPLDYGDATDYTGLILTEQELECLRAFIKYLCQQNDWDYLYINDIPETSDIIRLIATKDNLLPKFEFEKGEICPYILLPDSMDKYLTNLKPHRRKQLRLCLKNLERDHGKVELKEYYELGSLEDTMQLFFDLHQKRWKSKGASGAFNSHKMRNIFMDRARFFAEKDWLGLYFLTVNNKPVAVNYALKYNKKLSCCSTGFDTEYYHYGVGNLLLLKIIEKCIKQSFTEYDFMKGEESYKSIWTKKYRANFGLILVNKRFSSRLLKLFLDTKKRTIDYFLTKFNR